jgi:hypothetical protein
VWKLACSSFEKTKDIVIVSIHSACYSVAVPFDCEKYHCCEQLLVRVMGGLQVSDVTLFSYRVQFHLTGYVSSADGKSHSAC